MLAVWDIHDAMLDEYRTEISTGLGLPPWANHIAFGSPDLDDLDAALKRWLDNGLDCVRIDHGWCTSIYADDPNGITVEFCTSTRELTDEDRARPTRCLAASKPQLGTRRARGRVLHRERTPGACPWTSHRAPGPTS